MKIAEVVQKYWGGRAARYYDSISYLDDTKLTGALLGYLQKDKDGIILDCGTGTGSVASMLTRSGYRRIIGIDINCDMLAVAQYKLAKTSVIFLRGDVLNLPIASESLDAVVSKWILWVMPRPEKIVAEMARVTKPGGRVIAIESANHQQKEKEPLLRHILSMPLRKGHHLLQSVRYRLPLNRTEEFWRDTENRLPLYSLDKYVEVFRQQGLESVTRTEVEEFGTLRAKLFFGGFKFSFICGIKPGKIDGNKPASVQDKWPLSDLTGLLVCPSCRSKLIRDSADALKCTECRIRYPYVDRIPHLLPPKERML